MNPIKRKILIFCWIASLMIAFSLLIPHPVYADDCLSDPFNAADCMRTPGFRPAIAVIISVGSTLVTILVSVLGGTATAAGAAAAGAATGAAGVGVALPVTPVPPQPAGPVPPQPAEPVPPEPAVPGLEKMTPAEKQQLIDQITDYKKQLNKLKREELEWRVAQRWTWDLLERARTNYQSNSCKVIFTLGKEIGDSITTIVNAPAGLINAATNEFCNQVNNSLTTPPPSKATNAQILESQRKIISDLKEKYNEAKRMRAQKNLERTTIEEKISGLNTRIKNSFLVPWH